MTGKARVLIVDDSALIREILSSVLQSDPELEVVGTAADPLVARQMIKDLDPDVLTLDIEMPRMDGLAFLEKIMTLRPMPVIMVSTLTQKGAMTTLRALELGAVDFVAKPTSDLQTGLVSLGNELIPKIKSAARVNMQSGYRQPGGSIKPTAAAPSNANYASEHMAIAIGASTGGVVALRAVLCGLPVTAPPVLVTQHMPPKYTKSFADRLNQVCAVTVVEARHGQQVQPGHVYIAPGGQHLELKRNRGGYLCKVFEGPAVSGHCPSVDVLFTSFAENAGKQAIGTILTGMGRDGAVGLLQMRRAGAKTFGQSEASCVVYGMPRAASEIGAVTSELPLNQIAPAILQACVQPNSQNRRAS